MRVGVEQPAQLRCCFTQVAPRIPEKPDGSRGSQPYLYACRLPLLALLPGPAQSSPYIVVLVLQPAQPFDLPGSQEVGLCFLAQLHEVERVLFLQRLFLSALAQLL